MGNEEHPEQLDEEQMTKFGEEFGFFKVNLPSTFEDYQRGNGEGMWAVALNKGDGETANYEGPEKKQFYAYMANDSTYYPNLVYGKRVLAETRGENRCVAVWDGLVGSEDAEKNKEEVFEKMNENRNKEDN